MMEDYENALTHFNRARELVGNRAELTWRIHAGIAACYRSTGSRVDDPQQRSRLLEDAVKEWEAAVKDIEQMRGELHHALWSFSFLQEKRYVYRRNGLLDEIPHIRVDRSVFIILREHMKKIERFMKEWEDKIKWDAFDVLLDEERERMLRRCLDGR